MLKLMREKKYIFDTCLEHQVILLKLNHDTSKDQISTKQHGVVCFVLIKHTDIRTVSSLFKRLFMLTRQIKI